jgi:hypothetical protein
MHELNQSHQSHAIYIISLLISGMDNSYATAQELMPIISGEVKIDIHLALDEVPTLLG